MSRKDIPDVLVVQAAAARQFGDPFVDQILVIITGQPLKVCQRAIERSVSRGYVDYGVSLRTCWPTAKGLGLVGAAASTLAGVIT